MTRRLFATALATSTLVLLAVASPAVSLRPYMPQPVEFELAVDAGSIGAVRSAGAHGHDALVSRPLRAPRRFNLVGLRWQGATAEGLELELRVRREGGEWSAWLPLDADGDDGPDPGRGESVGTGVSSPLWAGEADWVQLRTSERLRGVRLEFVNTTGTATAAQRARTALRGAVSRGVLAVAAGLRLPGAHAADEPPTMVSRAEWGADTYCPPRGAPSYGEVKAAFVHHTVSANDYTRDQAAAAVLAICRYHRYTKGWDDVGYNFLVDRYGTIYEGRAGGVDQAVVGAQAQGWNAQTTGISNLGTFTSEGQTTEALDALARLIRWKLPLHGAPTAGTVTLTSAGGGTNRYGAGTPVVFERISGHRDGNLTACPGDALYAQLPYVRGRAGDGTPIANLPRSTLTASLSPALIRYGRRTRASGALTYRGGDPLAGQRVAVEEWAVTGWRVVAEATTQADGRFSAPVAPPGRRTLRVRYSGSELAGPATSRTAVVRVRARLRGSLAATRVTVHSSAVINGTLGPAKPWVRIALDRREGRRWRFVKVFRADATGGSFSRPYRFHRTGRYRFRPYFPGDWFNLRAAAAPLVVRVVAPPPANGGYPPAAPAGR